MINESIKKKIEYVNGYYNATAYPHPEVNGEEVHMVADIPLHRSSKCWILVTENYLALQSYNTIVTVFNMNNRVVTAEKYSRTTSRQQCWFRNFLDTVPFPCHTVYNLLKK